MKDIVKANILVLVLGLYSCAKEELAPFIHGEVIDKVTGRPVPNSAVFLQREHIYGGSAGSETARTVQAGPDGRFSFSRDSSYDLVGALAPGYLRIKEDDIYIYNNEKNIKVPIHPSGLLAVRIVNNPDAAVFSKVKVRPYFHEGIPNELVHYGGSEEVYYGQVRASQTNRIIIFYDWDLPGAMADTLWYSVPWMGLREMLVSY